MPKLFVVANQHMVFTKKKTWRSISRSWKITTGYETTQESCIHIDKFVWRLCVSYRPLNSVTRSFGLPISRCSDSIEDLGYSFGILFSISLDAWSGYYQIKVRICDQEKVVFFTPDGKYKCFVVMPFGMKNTPVFHTIMMKVLQEEWIILLMTHNMLYILLLLLPVDI